jgi:hypothetical protein
LDAPRPCRKSNDGGRYRKQRMNCTASASCQASGSTRGLKVGLWIVTAMAVAGIVFAQIEPLLK